MDEHNFESHIEGGVVVVSEVEPEEVSDYLDRNPGFTAGIDKKVLRALSSWAEDSRPSDRSKRGIFQRDKYVTPGKIFKQMAIAYDALDDDVVGNIADLSEAMAFQRVTFETQDDKDQENVWHQIGEDLDLDSFMRTMWRELFTVSVAYPVMWWGRKTYRVSEKREKRKSRKEFDIAVPTQLGFLDPTRVVPVMQDPFGNCQLAWIATRDEMQSIEKESDGLMSALFLGKYNATEKEKQDFTQEDIEPDQLLLLNPMYTWRHTLTKTPFERWARLRMKSVFPLLDLKHQLREMDRAFLLGGINFIVLVTRGTDDRPTSVNEINETTAQVRGQSRSPIIVSDHRINIEIITPDVQHVLAGDKWDVIDKRILMRLWGMFTPPGDSNRETSMTMGRVIARGLASRRHMMKRAFEMYVVKAVTEHPMNKEVGFTAHTFLEFAPRRMELEFDQSVVTMIQSLRDRGDMSRETILTEFGFDQALEATRREYEDERYKGVFDPVNVPFDSPNKNPDQSGRDGGGRPPGGKGRNEESTP